MTMLDSKAVFKARALNIGLRESELEVMKAKNWDSYGSLAFASSFQPGQVDETPLLKAAATICGVGAADPPDDRLPIIRRLFFEAFTFASADLRSRVESREDDAPRKLARPERTQRDLEQKERLAPIQLVGEREVSNALVDMLVQMVEEDQLRYVRARVMH